MEQLFLEMQLAHLLGMVSDGLQVVVTQTP
jgi:hypothetical protein